MNIGIFTNIYVPGISGVITVIENYRKELEKRGHKVFVFAPKYIGYKEKNPRIFRFNSINTCSKLSYPLPIIFSPRIDAIIKKLNLDIIHTQQFFVCGQIAWYYSKKFNVPLIFSYNTNYEFYADTYLSMLFGVPKEIGTPLIRILCSYYANSCDYVIVPAQDIKKLLLSDKVKSTITVLPTGIELKNFLRTDNGLIREKYNIGKDKILLLTASRLCPEKNIYFLLKAFKKIVSKYPEVYFMLVGDGISKKPLEKQAKILGIEKNTIFTGAILFKKMPLYYSSADIFIYSSLSETQGLTMVEAMACGLPVVAIKANGAQDIVVNNKNGFLCSSNIDEFVKKTSYLIDNKVKRKYFAKNAEITAQNYSIENSTEKLISIYEKAIEEKRKNKKIIKFDISNLNKILRKKYLKK